MADGTEEMSPGQRAPPAASYPSQTFRKAVIWAVVVIAIAFLLVGDSRWPGDGNIHESIEWAGLALIAFCIVGRTWCALYIGGRKHRALVTVGPYSISRNPLYMFSIIGAVGVGAQLGSLVAALSCGVIAWAVFLWTAWREETSLTMAFGDDYVRYRARVPRFLPNFSLWHSPERIVVEPRVVRVTFVDALVFLIAVPLAESVEYLREIGSLPVYILLP